jgi:hypothetical protein
MLFVGEIIFYYVSVGVGIAHSVERLAIGWTVGVSNPGGARFSEPIRFVVSPKMNARFT